MDVILRADGVDLFYGTEQAVSNADLVLKRGEVAAIMGSSGSGKSSLLYCLAGVLPPTNGTVTFDGIQLSSLPDGELSALRRTRLGFVFQYGELLPELTVEENAALPLRLMRHQQGSCACCGRTGAGAARDGRSAAAQDLEVVRGPESACRGRTRSGPPA